MVDLKTVALTAAGTAGTALLIWPLAVWFEVKRLEKPRYSLIRPIHTRPTVELRCYAPFVVAQVTVSHDEMGDAMSEGFKSLAGYIFGGNVGKEKVSMTSPVVTQKKEAPEQDSQGGSNGIKGGSGSKISMTSPVQTTMSGTDNGSWISMTKFVETTTYGADRYTIAFMMPSKYTLETLPKPNNSRVEFKEVPARTVASISWRGARPRPEFIEAKKDKLLDILEQHSITAKPSAGSTELLSYYPPFAPSWIQLQEVLVPVEDVQGCSDKKDE